MELGINPSYFTKNEDRNSYDVIMKYARLCTEAGLPKLDLSVPTSRPDFLEFAKRLRESFDKEGIEVHQSHAPFNRYEYRHGARLEDFRPKLYASVEAASALGSRYLVVHADEYVIPEGEEYSPKAAEDFTYELLAPMVEKAERLGVKIAIENLFEDKLYRQHPESRFTSRIEELISIIERFSGRVGCCWDFGHGKVAFGDTAFEKFKTVFPHIVCTHVHDNYYNMDLHTLPTLGSTNFAPFIRYMKENGYSGELVYELVYGSVPEALVPDFLKYAKGVGDYLLSL